ncbi:aminotransferase class I/II-fold pyridoxal phosphate-dependent enzyme [Methylobacterium aquaticum]|uniref:aminotransferase class I/II-fold pyridoxal phosphate-dependent enzyme n=1 Tax=Methylobacterium aquaticum TaxID=270351 RepID=UPI0019341287|nr:aminotransferase class I/II-fold pyridoxal phosphate-dependent enzyme [Methylobacterium aquaticum]QRE76817.1 aminotransferase class I/II-fold pyridoxal phosphate-dependent enzyme [Methylobacterium aquaticum]
MPKSQVEPALAGSVTEKYHRSEVNLVNRWTALGNWFEDRNSAGLDPYQKYSRGPIQPITRGAYRDGRPFEGVNFASQDYLSLSTHPKIVEAAISAAKEYGVHSAGSAALMGNTQLSIDLECQLSEYLNYQYVTLFTTGWGAGYGVVKTLLREGDHVVIDNLAHACLQEAAVDAKAHIYKFPHLSVPAVERRLKRIRQHDKTNGILVITESLFSMDSDTPDLINLQLLCREYNAVLLVDCAHDLGAIGTDGKGVLGEQKIWGKIDVLMGSFSKTFSSVGGFVACNNAGLRFGLRAACGPSTFTNAMGPIQAAVILASLSIVRSDEGKHRRRLLHENTLLLRQKLIGSGFTVIGRPSPIVPMIVGSTPLARLATKFVIEYGGIVNLVEHPAVARNRDRWRLQVMADHKAEHIERMVDIAVRARDSALDCLDDTANF